LKIQFLVGFLENGPKFQRIFSSKYLNCEIIDWMTCGINI
jgi:uncharacterized membrane protein